VKISRRRFLQAGLVGVGALVVARVAYRSLNPAPVSLPALGRPAQAIFASIVPVLLGSMLPTDHEARRMAIEATIAGVEHAVAGLPPYAQSELGDLISLLAFAPTRSLVAGVWSPWDKASAETVGKFLSDWRTSRFALLQSAYQALHQLVYAAWYGNPQGWQAIGYPGAPELRP